MAAKPVYIKATFETPAGLADEAAGILVAGGAFFFALMSLLCLLGALVGYKARLEQDALTFTDNLFQGVFADMDADYLVAVSNPDPHRRDPRAQASAFVVTVAELGRAKEKPAFRSALILLYLDGHFRASDHLFARTVFDRGIVSIDVQISRDQGDWGVDHLNWRW